MSASPSARTSSGCAASSAPSSISPSEATTLGTGAARGDAGARPAGLPRDERGLAEERRSSRSPSSTATVRRSAAAASATTIRYKLEEFPDYLIKAALATEDRRFYEHWGIDPIGTFRALTVNARGGGVVQGGSSITQQLAKNLFLTNERSLERKIKEAFLAVWLEFHLTEDEILKLYLDRAYMGGGTHRRRGGGGLLFRQVGQGHHARRIGDAGGPVQGADQIRAARQPAGGPRPRQRRAHNMVEAGFLTEGQIQTARRNPATPVNRSRETTPDYYLDWAFEQVKKLAARRQARQRPRPRPSRRPSTTRIQQQVEQALESLLRQMDGNTDAGQGAHGRHGPGRRGARHASAARIMARASSTAPPTHCASRARRSRRIVYSAALLGPELYRPNSIVVDTPICLGNWCPQNYSRRSFAGIDAADSAPCAKSINSIPVIMSIDRPGRSASATSATRKSGRAKIIETARAMGLTHAARRFGLAADRRRRGDGDRP